MAIKLDAGEVTRTDISHIWPEHIIALDEDNSRKTPHTQEEIIALASRILEFGQKQAGVVRRVEGNKVKLVAGFGRYKAVQWINEHHPEKKVKYKCVVSDMNPEEAFLVSISENLDRLDTNQIDDAHAQRRLREEFGWSEEKIAEFYKKSVSYIAQVRKTLQLSKQHQEMVASGNMNFSTALEVTQLPEVVRNEVVTEATDIETGKVDATVVKQKVRQHKQSSDGNGGSLARTMKEVRAFLKEQTKPHEQESIRNLCGKFLDFIKGEISEVNMERALVEFISYKEPVK